ncbi:MAG: hypothetical protein KGY75_10080, partial [Candidatus Cloacimonetes bacterium]|nr:hypothetical protein [Candidatus Cloacimonadota bacterium]
MKKEETFSKKRMGQITAILFILCLIFATPHLITADEMYHPTNSQSPLTFNPCRNMIIKPYTDDCGDYPAPQWEFVTLPDSIMTSYYDYMPFSYRGFHIMQQTENGDSWYMTWFGIPDLDPSTNRRQYYAEIGADGSLLDWNLISSNDIWQGYGDICIHPATGLPIATWHEDNPSSGGGITISYPDSTWPGSYTFFPPTNPGENVYMWPQIYIGPSPEGSGYCRIYLISRKLDDNPYGSPCETPRILFIDVENINDPSVLEPILEFDNWNEVNPMQDWWQNDIRPYKLNFAIDYINPGIVALMGSAANLSGYDNPPVNDGPFVWISQDYGATWDESNLYGISDTTGVLYYVENIPRYVPDDDSIKVIDMLGHSTGLFDNQGEIHFPFRQ